MRNDDQEEPRKDTEATRKKGCILYCYRIASVSSMAEGGANGRLVDRGRDIAYRVVDRGAAVAQKVNRSDRAVGGIVDRCCAIAARIDRGADSPGGVDQRGELAQVIGLQARCRSWFRRPGCRGKSVPATCLSADIVIK